MPGDGAGGVLLIPVHEKSDEDESGLGFLYIYDTCDTVCTTTAGISRMFSASVKSDRSESSKNILRRPDSLPQDPTW